MRWLKNSIVKAFSFDFEKLVCPKCGWPNSTEHAVEKTITHSFALSRNRCPKCNATFRLRCPQCQRPLQSFRLWPFTWREGFLGIRICQNCGCAVNKLGKKVNSK
jgi:transcription elongation factor Elf1